MEKEKIWVECMYNTNGASLVLTVGKQYLATIIDEHTYRMENDKGEFDWFSKGRFKIVNKTPILSTIKWNGVDDIDIIINVAYHIIIKCKSHVIRFVLLDNANLDNYIFELNNNKLAIDKFNQHISKFNIKIELDQPKFKINCDKLYTKEEAEKLRESGIDVMEVKNETNSNR